MRKFKIKVNGNQYDVEVEEIGGASAPVQTTLTSIQSEQPKAAPAVSQSAPSSGANTVTSPMPGTILKIMVASGDSVKKGQVLLILEAMKMENEIVSPSDGKIASVNVSKGSSVNAGDVLVSID